MRIRTSPKRLARRFLVAVFASAALLSADGSALAQRVLGLDISAWQGNISTTTWATFKRPTNQQVGGVFGDGRDFVFLRSSRGGTTGEDHRQGGYAVGQNTFYNLSQRYDDPYFVQNFNRATSAGIFAGSYHFDRADILATTLNSDGVTTAGVANDGTDEANHLIQMAGAWMRPGYLLPVLDLEAGSNRSQTDLSNFAVAFSDRIYAVMGIRPMVYANSSYANDEINSSVATSMPNLWIARPSSADPVTTEPPAAPAYPNIYGKWNPLYPNTPNPAPWQFWQYNTGPGLNGYSGNIDKDAAHGDIEYVKDFLVPALWMTNSDGDWSTLANWNSGQTPVAPVTGPGQLAAVGLQTLPTTRLPGAAGTGVNDTVILDRSSANITSTLSTGAHNIRKMYMRETLNVTGGSLTINYDPNYNFNVGVANAVRSGPLSAQFSGAVTLSGTGSLSVHTLQVDATRTFTLAGSTGSLTFNRINLMPHSTTPAKILVSGDVTINPLNNGNPLNSLTATIANGSGSGNSGFVDLGGGTRGFNIGNGSADIDLDVAVPITNGGLTKSGAGTMQLSGNNTFAGPVTVNAGVLKYNHSSGLSPSSVLNVNNGGSLDMNSISDTVAGLTSSAGQTTGLIKQGTANLTVSAVSGSNTYGGTINGTGTFTKSGASTQILTGNNSLGPVTLSGGSLLFNGTNTTGAVTVNGGVLGGTGSVSGAVTVNNTGHIAPGASIETLDVGALTLNSGSVLDFELGTPGVGDCLSVSGLLAINGGSVQLTDLAGLGAGTYTLIDYGTLSGNLSLLGTPTGPTQFNYSLVDTGSVISLLVALPGVAGDFNNDGSVDGGDYIVWRKNMGTAAPLPNDNNIGGVIGSQHYNLWRSHFGETAGSGASLASATVIPEPATLALLVGAVLPFLLRRRQRPQG